MSSEAKSILRAALALPDADRAVLVEKLAASLPHDDVDLMTDEELEAELERRAEEHRKDPSVAIPWSQFNWDEPK